MSFEQSWALPRVTWDQIFDEVRGLSDEHELRFWAREKADGNMQFWVELPVDRAAALAVELSDLYDDEDAAEAELDPLEGAVDMEAAIEAGFAEETPNGRSLSTEHAEAFRLPAPTAYTCTFDVHFDRARPVCVCSNEDDNLAGWPVILAFTDAVVEGLGGHWSPEADGEEDEDEDDEDDEDEDEGDEEDVTFGDELAILPLRGAVLFPGTQMPINVGREKTVALLRDLDRLPAPVVAVVAQRDPSIEDPDARDLCGWGCAAWVQRVEDAGGLVVLHGLTRVQIERVISLAPYPVARVRRVDDPAPDQEAEALAERVRQTTRKIAARLPDLPSEAVDFLEAPLGAGALADKVAAVLDADFADKQQVIETVALTARLQEVLELAKRHLEMLSRP